MVTGNDYVDQAIAHEAGHIVVGSAFGFPIGQIAVEIVREPGRTRLGSFITHSIEPSDAALRQTPRSVLEDYKLFVAAGLAGNNLARTGVINDSLQSDRRQLERVSSDSLEVTAEKAKQIIQERSEIFQKLIDAITERFVELMNDRSRGSGRHMLLSQQELIAICGTPERSIFDRED